MRKLVVALILILAPVVCSAADSRLLFMAAADFIPLPATQTFNSSMEGWSGVGYSGSSDRVNSMTVGGAGITSATIKTPACTMTVWSRFFVGTPAAVNIRVNGGGWQALHPGTNTWVSDTVALPHGTNFIEIQTVSGYTAQFDDFSFN